MIKKIKTGFTLIEVIISMAIILVLFSLLLMESNTLSISRSQQYEDIAYHIANKQMESLRATAFSDLPASADISDLSLDQLPSGSGNFTINDYSGYTGMKEIEVTVNWSVNNVAKSIVIKTLAGSGGINP